MYNKQFFVSVAIFFVFFGGWKASQLANDGNFSKNDVILTVSHSAPWAIGWPLFLAICAANSKKR
ncbi:MAG: hypothetical protein ACRCXZ_00305 [Patescibacteria group bacterium]